MAFDAESLINTAYAAKYPSLSTRDLLECIVASACAGGGGGGGGGSGFTCVALGGAAPATTPSCGSGIIDTDTGNVWLYSTSWKFALTL